MYSDDEDEYIDKKVPQIIKHLRYEIGEKCEGCTPGISCTDC